MSPLRLVRKYFAYVRTGYPPAAPTVGYNPLLALMAHPAQGGGTRSATTVGDANGVNSAKCLCRSPSWLRRVETAWRRV
jgi:hypothetical protein